MTNKQIFNALLDDENIDQILWAARLDIWYMELKAVNSLPERYQQKSLNDIYRSLGIGFPQKSADKYLLYRTEIDGVECHEKREGPYLHKYIETPVGIVFETYFIDDWRCERGLPFGETHVGYLFKSLKDYPAIEYIIANTKYLPSYEQYFSYEEEIGDEGLAFFYTTNDPFSTLMRDYFGIERFVYELMDSPKHVDNLFHSLTDVMENGLQPIMFECPSRVAHHGAHYDGAITSPPLFKKYILPYLRRFSDKLHGMKKFLALHTDADSELLLELMERAGMDMAECFCTNPMVAASLESALNCWQNRVLVWGGIPSVILCPKSYSYEDFCLYIRGTIDLIRSRNCRVILGVSDNVMPETDITRLEKITEMVEKANRGSQE